VDELKKAGTAWLVAGLVIVPVVPVAQSFGTLGATTLPLRLGPVLALEYAIQFIALAVPSSAARVAVSVRFFQRQGAPAAQALTIGLIDSVFGFVVQVLLLIVIVFSGLVTLDLSLDGLNVDPSGKLLVLVGIVAVAAVVIALTVPKIRRPISARIAEARPALAVIRSPIKLAGLLGGNFVAQLLLAIVLGLTVRWGALAERFFNWDDFSAQFPDIILEAARNTLIYTAIGFTGGLFLGLIAALMRQSSVAPARRCSSTSRKVASAVM